MYATKDGAAPTCQVVRTLDVIGEKWSLLIIRNALRGQTRFSEFRDSLGVPSDILTARLATLVEAGVLDKRPYRQPGSRERSSYHLTESGEALRLVVGALIQWGDTYRPSANGRGSRTVDPTTEQDVDVAFVAADGRLLDVRDVAIVPGPAATTTW